jgi:hypothetical protein
LREIFTCCSWLVIITSDGTERAICCILVSEIIAVHRVLPHFADLSIAPVAPDFIFLATPSGD